MWFEQPAARERFLRLSLSQMLALMAMFAIVSAVWMYRLQAPLRQQAKRQATLESAERQRTTFFKNVTAKDAQAVTELLQAGADPNALYSDSIHGYAPVLHIAVRNGDLATFKLLVEAGASARPLEAVMRSDIPVAVKAEMLRVLLEHGADVKHGRAAMDAALESDATEIVALLRRAGAVYGPREMALAGNSGELRAAVEADPKLLERPLDEYYRGHKSLLAIALLRGHEDLAAWLLDAGAPLEMYELHHMSAMHTAALGNCAGIIKRLRSAGLDVNAGDVSGDTPLDYCISRAVPRTIEALIEAGADVNKQSGPQRQTALHRVVTRYDAVNRTNADNEAASEIIAMLLRAGADPDAKDANGQSPLDLACTKSPDFFWALLERL